MTAARRGGRSPSRTGSWPRRSRRRSSAALASAAGLPAQQWTFPFHLFCSLAVSAAKLSLTTIERWLGIEFLPAPLTPERTASLAVLVAEEASALEQGCRCKAEADGDEAAFARRGPCRQADHDLRAVASGTAETRQPYRGAVRQHAMGMAAPLARRDAGRAGRHERASRSGCSCAPTTWPAASWPAGGCPATAAWAVRSCSTTASCRSSAWPAAARSSWRPVPTRPGGRSSGGRPAARSSNWSTAVNSVGAAPEPVLKPKLGIIVTWPSENEGKAGYASTAPLGPLWVCRRSGRYSLSERHCPSAECRADGECSLGPVHHGWVLLPRSDAWANLRDTGGPVTTGRAEPYPERICGCWPTSSASYGRVANTGSRRLPTYGQWPGDGHRLK